MVRFYEIGRFSGVTRCIDCIHVPIVSPGVENVEVFRHHNRFFSSNMQVNQVDVDCLNIIPGTSQRLFGYKKRLSYDKIAFEGFDYLYCNSNLPPPNQGVVTLHSQSPTFLDNFFS